MHGVLGAARAPSRNGSDRSVAKTSVTDTSVGDDENWFSDAALSLLGTEKPGTALDCVTDFRFGERNCQRYAGGDVKPPGYFVRALLRGKHGEQWLNAIMDGCDAPWWRDLQRARRIADAIASID